MTGGECPCSGNTEPCQCMALAADNFTSEHFVYLGGDKIHRVDLKRKTPATLEDLCAVLPGSLLFS